MSKQKLNFTFEPALIEEIERTGTIMTFQLGDVIIQPGKYIKAIPLLTRGTIKVLRVDPNGNELFLYHITTGQSCAASLSTSLTDKISQIKAVAEEETELIAVSSTNAAKWFSTYPSWRAFVFMTMDTRFEELIKTLDSVAFSKTDDRLVAFLSAKSKALSTNNIQITHQEIANELSTSREVISRLLKQLEQYGKVKLSRNNIEIIFPL